MDRNIIVHAYTHIYVRTYIYKHEDGGRQGRNKSIRGEGKEGVRRVWGGLESKYTIHLKEVIFVKNQCFIQRT